MRAGDAGTSTDADLGRLAGCRAGEAEGRPRGKASEEETGPADAGLDAGLDAVVLLQGRELVAVLGREKRGGVVPAEVGAELLATDTKALDGPGTEEMEARLPEGPAAAAATAAASEAPRERGRTSATCGPVNVV